MALDLSVRALLDQMKALALPKVWELAPAAARAAMKSRILSGKETPSGPIRNLTIPGPANDIALRSYTPLDAKDAMLPGLVFFHGGGFALGDLDTHDDLCRHIANGSGCRIVSVDYRLAPEHPFPAGVEDCYAATKWVAEHAADLGIGGPLAVGGDSAGGNLAAVVAQLAKTQGPALAYQLLIYPVTQLGGPELPSMEENAKGYFLERESMQWYTRMYCPDAALLADPRMSPLRAKDLSGLPPAYVVTAGFDPLRDEGKAYADKLDAAGVPVTYVNYPGMVHGFFSLRGFIPKAREAVAAASAALKASVTAE